MHRFAFMVHPVHIEQIYSKFSFARYLPTPLLKALMKYVPPLNVSEVRGIRSDHGATEGWFVGCPYTTDQMKELPEDVVMRKVIATGRLAERLGAEIIGLGAFTAIVGDKGRELDETLNIPVTTGNSYTVATAIEGAQAAAEEMGIDLRQAEVAVVGATGSIGRACSIILARDAHRLTLFGRSERRLEAVAAEVRETSGRDAATSVDITGDLPRVDVVVTVSSAAEAIINPQDLKSGAVVCDVARPRDVSKAVSRQRDDVLVIEGGVVRAPGEDISFNLDFGVPGDACMACMAETFVLAMEGTLESFTVGAEINVDQIDKISHLASKHGFELCGFRSFEREMSQARIAAIRERAGRSAVAAGTSS